MLSLSTWCIDHEPPLVYAVPMRDTPATWFTIIEGFPAICSNRYQHSGCNRMRGAPSHERATAMARLLGAQTLDMPVNHYNVCWYRYLSIGVWDSYWFDSIIHNTFNIGTRSRNAKRKKIVWIHLSIHMYKSGWVWTWQLQLITEVGWGFTGQVGGSSPCNWVEITKQQVD